MRIPSGVTDQYIYFIAVDSTDYVSRETGLSSFTVYRSRNGAAAAAMTTPTINEVDSTNMPGVYELLLDEDMTIGSGNDTEAMVFHITATGMLPVTKEVELYRPKITAGNTLGVESDGDLTKVNTLDGHTAQTGDNYARLGAPAGASVSSDIAAIEAQTDDIGVAGAGLTALPWNSAWDAEVQSEVTDALNAYDPPTKSELDSGLAGLNDLSAAQVNTEVDTALADYDPPTKAELDAGLAALNDLSAAEVNAEVVDVLTVDALADSYASDGSQPTIGQAVLAILQFLTEKSASGTTISVKKPDGTTTAMTFTLDSATVPTSITRAT